MFSLTQLEYIVAVEKFGNFRQAAKACHITQPTLSMQIQKLEDHLGVEIFDRSQQPIVPTPLGQKILNQARLALVEAQRISALIDAEKDSVEGELRLGVIPTLAPYVLPLFLGRFVELYPKLKLHIEELKTSDILTLLKKDALDIGLLATPLHEPLTREYPIFLEPFYVYAPKDSHLSAYHELNDDDLKDETILLLMEGHCLREQMVRVCGYRESRAKRNRSFSFESGSIETLCRLVERGHGYTIIPHLARSSVSGRSGRVIPFSAPVPSREVSLIVYESYAREATIRALLDCIKASLPTELRDKNLHDRQAIKLR